MIDGLMDMKDGNMHEGRPDGAFDYAGAVAELEKIAAKVESDDVGIDDMDRCIRRTEELISGCRRYLRSARERAAVLGRGSVSVGQGDMPDDDMPITR